MRTILIAFFLLLTIGLEAADFSDFQKILTHSLHVKNMEAKGWYTAFDYQALYNSESMMEHLENQKKVLKEFDIKSLSTKAEANAFWINAYNFFMVATVISEGFRQDELKIKSVKDMGGFFNPYRIFKEKMHTIGDKKYSLDEIEKGILLGQDFKDKGWFDARVHFAVNCASVGCPPLHPKVYSSKNIDETLDENIKKALMSSRHLRIEGKDLYLTHLFKWYSDDFEFGSGSKMKFIRKYLKDENKLNQLNQVKKIRYIDYDWNLNIPAHFLSQ